MKRLMWIFCSGLLLLAAPTFADTYVVRPDGSGDFPTIQAAINAVSDRDTIELTNGTFTGDGNRDIDYLGKAIVVRSQSSNPNSCVINCQGSETNRHRGFFFHSGEGPESVLEGIKVTNGHASYVGGGVFCRDNSSPTFTNCTIRNNHALGDYLDGRGGGVCIGTGCSSTLTNCTISGNSVNSWGFSNGGGICGSGTFINCTISDNSVHSSVGSCGGGAYGGGTFRNCTFSDNWANFGGAAFVSSTGTFANCVFRGNSASDYGGGVYCDYASPIFTNCIFWGNNPDQISGGNPDVAYSDIQGGWPGTGNIDADPRFRSPENGDFHLMWTECGDLFDSPCIDAGDPSIEDDSLDCDFGLGTRLCDMGVYGGNAVPLGVSHPDEPVIIPEGFALFQNYPNPFNPTTTIRYDVAQVGHVRLTIYNLLGQEVARLVDKQHLAGSYTVAWNASTLPSGIYFCRMEAPGFVHARKMALVK